MNYQYHHDGTNSRYTVNGTDYASLEEVPEEHRAHFQNLDKNKNGIPDNVENLFNSMKSSSGEVSLRKVVGTLFDAIEENVTSERTIEPIRFQEVKEVKNTSGPKRTVVEPRQGYDKRGGVIQRGEKSFLPTLIKIAIGAAIIFAGLWYFGVIR